MKTRDRQPSGRRRDQRRRVARPQPHVVERVLLDAGERLGDPVEERLATDEPDIAPRPGLRQQMFRPAKADLQPDFVRREREQSAAIADLRAADLEPRQKLGDQARLMGPQPSAPAAPVERAARRIAGRLALLRRAADQATRPRSWLTRSVFSHEKPPSASGGRPKCP